MPIYMDRHDVSEAVTAEHVAELHQRDLKIQDQFGCRGLTYWFDDKRKTAFCLIEAPDEKTLENMHNKAHGQIPNSIIEVDAGIVESFLGRIEDPVKSQKNVLNIIDEPAFRTIMVMKIHELAVQKKDSILFKDLLSKFNAALPGILDNYAVKVVKQARHHYLVSFNSVSNAVRAAIDLNALFKKFSGEINTTNHLLKIGISAGPPVTEKKSIFEDTIKSAERMCAFINGDIIVSSEVKELYDNENITPLSEYKKIITLSPADENFLHLLLDYTEKNWNNVNLKADDFCKPMGISKSQLYRKMMALNGKSPNTFIKECRLTAALQLLNKKAGNISEIAFETGFSSPSYFSKCFQKRYGVIPSDYISAMR
jgi:AraC-like DNA-binding protein